MICRYCGAVIKKKNGKWREVVGFDNKERLAFWQTELLDPILEHCVKAGKHSPTRESVIKKLLKYYDKQNGTELQKGSQNQGK